MGVRPVAAMMLVGLLAGVGCVDDDAANVAEVRNPGDRPSVSAPAAENDDGQEAVVYAFAEDSDGFVERYIDLATATVRVDGGLGRAEFLAEVLKAATTVDSSLRPPFSASAVPTVAVDGATAVLDWDREAASQELAAWGTSSGSTGLNPVLGMVFENDPSVEFVEMRINGSCALFTETLQDAGCASFTRERWNQFRSG